MQKAAFQAFFRSVIRLALLAAIAWAGLQAFELVSARASTAASTAALIVIIIAYAALLAIPFMPGIELGLTLLMMRGAEVAPLVWLATVAGLTLAFVLGRLMPSEMLARALDDLHLKRAARLIRRLSGQPQNLRLRWLCLQTPRLVRPVLRDWRYIALGLVLNVPGNAVIGGGGGIAMLAGLSGVFRPAAALATFLLATLPVPLAVWLFGPDILPWTH